MPGPESDDRITYRKTIYNGIVNQYFTYLNHVYADVGGVYLYEKHVEELGRTLPERSPASVRSGVGIPVGTARRHGVVDDRV